MTEVGYLPSGFETEADAGLRRARLAGQLSRSGLSGAETLAASLIACCGAQPCGSGACPTCQRSWRLGILSQADKALLAEPLMRLSWVPAGGLVARGHLAHFDLTKFLASRRRALQRALPGIAMFGGADISLNTVFNDEGIWQIHIYVVIEASDTPILRKAIRERCSPEPTAARPFHFRVASDRAAVLSYAVKASVYRRSSYLDSDGHRNTRSQGLKPQESVEAAIFQHAWPPPRRLILSGLRHYHGSDGPTLLRLNGALVVKGSGRISGR